MRKGLALEVDGGLLPGQAFFNLSHAGQAESSRHHGNCFVFVLHCLDVMVSVDGQPAWMPV